MGLPSALHRKCCASNKSTFPPLLNWRGPCLCTVFLSHQQISSQVLSNKEFNFNHKKKNKKNSFHRFPTCMRRPIHHAPSHLHTHIFRRRTSAHTKPFRSWALGLLALSQLFFFPIGKPGKLIEPVCVAKRLASTGSGGGKLSCVSFFFSLAFSQRPGSI